MSSTTSFFEIEKIPEKRIAIVYLNRPDKRNSMSWEFWSGLPAVVDAIESDECIRAVVIAARGKSFTTGLDLEEFDGRFADRLRGETADTRMKLYDLIKEMQKGFQRMMKSDRIFISAVHRHCIGGGLDLICACDIRLGSKDAVVSLRETKVAIVADMGSLNLLPFIVGHGNARRMAFTGADFDAAECHRMGLFDEVLEDRDAMMDRAVNLAEEIAANPAIVLKGTKQILNYMYNHTPDEGMDYVAVWNAAFLDSDDFRELMSAFKERRRPNYK